MSLLQTGISLHMEPRAVSGLAAASRWLLVCSLSTTSVSRLFLRRMQSPLSVKARWFLAFGRGFLAFVENQGNKTGFLHQELHGKEIPFEFICKLCICLLFFF